MDLYPEDREKIENAALLRPALGGSSGNIAAGLARLGHKVEMLSMVSDDPVGRFVRAECLKYGIGTRYLKNAPKGTNTNLAMAENRLDDFEVVIYRNNAADLALDMESISKVNFNEFNTLVLTATALSAEPSRSATLEAMKRAKHSVLDLDYRAAAWIGQDPKSILEQAMALADIVVGNDEEFALIGGFERAKEFGAHKIAIYKMGEKGAVTIAHGREFTTPIFPVEALKPVGAGDAFMAGMLGALAQEKPIDQAVIEGAANAAIVVSRPACAPAMATQIELEKFVKERNL